MAPTLKLSDLDAGYGRRHSHPILEGVNFELHQGDIAVIIGPNGAGKSTLLRTLCGAIPPLSGQIYIDGHNLASMSVAERARKIAMVYTERPSGGGLTVRDLVTLGRHPHRGLLGRISAADRIAVDQALSTMGITTLADARLADISDGERQKAMMARALAQNTPLIMLDEPTSFLDVAARIEMTSLIASLAADLKRTLLLSTHDIAQAMRVATHVLAVNPDDRSARLYSIDDPALPQALSALFAKRGITYDAATADFRASLKI